MTGTVFVNGRFVSAEAAVVSVFDRGWMYGDGLFETVRVCNGTPFQWDAHWDRLLRGLGELRFSLPYTREELRKAARELSGLNQLTEGVLRLAVSRGTGPRGYSPRGADRPTCVMTIGAMPARNNPEAPLQWRAVTSRRIQIHANALAQLKTANRLPQILARMEADDAGVEEALVCDPEGHLVEASSGNLFWIHDGALHTPPVSLGGLPGIARATVFHLAANADLSVTETVASAAVLREAEGAFLSLSTYGVVELIELDGHALGRHAETLRLWRAWEDLVTRGTQGEQSV